MSTVVQDIRYALRMLRKSPGFTVVAVLTLALGIGANVAIYSAVDAVLIRPLPFDDPERLVFVWGVEGGLKSGSSWNSWPDVVDFEERNEVFSELASFSTARMTLRGGGREPQRVDAAMVTHDLFPVLGLEAATGRGILAEDDRLGAEPVVVLGHGLRRDLFGDDDGVGRTIDLDGTEHTVIGVMPEGVGFPDDSRLRLPLVPYRGQDSRGRHSVLTLGRMKTGVDLDAAQANMVSIAAALEAEYPESNHDRSARVQPVFDAIAGGVRPSLLTVFAAVGLVLLIACTNVASLLLSRASVRGRELAVRAAIGAGPARLVRQLLTESLILALIGGTCGVLFAMWSLDLLVSLAPATIPRIALVALNARVLVFAIVLALGTGVVFGLVPALQGRRRDLQDALKESGRGSFAGGERLRLRQVLVVAEVALAFVVVAGAGLLGNSLARLYRVDPGFDGEGVLTARVALPEGSYPEWQQATRFFDQLVTRLEAIPGVESAAAGYQHPMAGGWETSFSLPGVFEAPAGQRPEARILPITPGYFDTVGMRVVAGRAFSDRDDAAAPGVVIVNESFANRFFPEGDAVGHRLVRSRWWEELPGDFEIVGVVADVKMDGLSSGTPWAMYYPQKQQPFQDMYVLVRSQLEPTSLAASVRRAVWELDPGLPVEDFAPLETLRTATVAQQRFNVTLLGMFAVVALVLAAIGIYGVLASGVAQRRGEIGVRMALGASPADVLRAVLGQGMRLAGIGLVVGVAGTVFASRLIAGLLFEISPSDPTTLGSVAIFFAAVAALACLLPAARATRVEPVQVLRAE